LKLNKEFLATFGETVGEFLTRTSIEFCIFLIDNIENVQRQRNRKRIDEEKNRKRLLA
jgi:hypothetical protein